MGGVTVSVVIDCYNHEAFVEAAIAGVLADDWAGIAREVVVVDDGSTDRTAERARRHEPAVRCVRQPNGGQAAAFNTGARETRGEVLCFLDGDDLWYPGKAAAVARAFADDPGAGFVQTPLETVDAAGRPLRRPRTLPPERVELDDALDGRSVLVGTSGLCVRRSVFDAIAPVPSDLTTCADDYVSKHALFLAHGRTVARVLGGLRLHGGNNFQGALRRPAALERYLDVHRRLDGYLEARLARAGRALSPAGLRARRLDRATKEILLRGWNGERGRAFAAWRALRRELPASRFGAFKLATLLLAVASPRAYVRLHGFYEDAGPLPRLRASWLAEGG